MKRILAVLMIVLLLISGCSRKNVPAETYGTEPEALMTEGQTPGPEGLMTESQTSELATEQISEEPDLTKPVEATESLEPSEAPESSEASGEGQAESTVSKPADEPSSGAETQAPTVPGTSASQAPTAPPSTSASQVSTAPSTSSSQPSTNQGATETEGTSTEHVHHFVETESKPYTCTEDGYLKEVCSECGTIHTVIYHAPGHTPGPWTIDAEPTQTTAGHAFQTCSVCGAVLAEKEIPATGAIQDAFAKAVLDLVNAEREKAGLNPLSLDSSVCAAAQKRAEETTSLFSHTRPDGRSCFTALDEAGVSYMMAGENIAAGQQTPEEVMNSWMNSEGHRANILKPEFTHMGLGYAEKADDPECYYVYWAQLFIAR